MSDRGTSFTSKEFEEFMSEMKAHKNRHRLSPQANGQVERYNRVLAPTLGKLCTGRDWHKPLGEIEFAINNTVNRTTGKTPSELLYGVNQRGHVVDASKEFILEQDEGKVRDLNELGKELRKKLRKRG